MTAQQAAEQAAAQAAALLVVIAQARTSADAERKLREVVRDAHNTGAPVADLARAAGVTRQTVYRWIR